MCLADLLYQTCCEVYERHIDSVHDLSAIWSTNQDCAVEAARFVSVGFLETGLGVFGDHSDEGAMLEGVCDRVQHSVVERVELLL